MRINQMILKENNDLLKRFIIFFSYLTENDFQLYMDYFIHNKIHHEIASFVDYYNTLNKKYDFLVTKAFLKALEVRDLYYL